MSPTVFREDGYRFFFFSREEKRMHVHVVSGDGEAKFWLEPEIELAKNYNEFSSRNDENSFGTGMCRHDQWPQAIDHVSKWKIVFSIYVKETPTDGCFRI